MVRDIETQIASCLRQLLIVTIKIFFDHISESKPHFALSKWSLQEESHSTYDVSEQASTEPKLRHRGSATTPGIRMCPIPTSSIRTCPIATPC
jgi:hypothetical protein